MGSEKLLDFKIVGYVNGVYPVYVAGATLFTRVGPNWLLYNSQRDTTNEKFTFGFFLPHDLLWLDVCADSGKLFSSREEHFTNVEIFSIKN